MEYFNGIYKRWRGKSLSLYCTNILIHCLLVHPFTGPYWSLYMSYDWYILCHILWYDVDWWITNCMFVFYFCLILKKKWPWDIKMCYICHKSSTPHKHTYSLVPYCLKELLPIFKATDQNWYSNDPLSSATIFAQHLRVNSNLRQHIDSDVLILKATWL